MAKYLFMILNHARSYLAFIIGRIGDDNMKALLTGVLVQLVMSWTIVLNALKVP